MYAALPQPLANTADYYGQHGGVQTTPSPYGLNVNPYTQYSQANTADTSPITLAQLGLIPQSTDTSGQGTSQPNPQSSSQVTPQSNPQGGGSGITPALVAAGAGALAGQTRNPTTGQPTQPSSPGVRTGNQGPPGIVKAAQQVENVAQDINKVGKVYNSITGGGLDAASGAMSQLGDITPLAMQGIEDPAISAINLSDLNAPLSPSTEAALSGIDSGSGINDAFKASGTVAAELAAPLAIYNFVQNWQTPKNALGAAQEAVQAAQLYGAVSGASTAAGGSALAGAGAVGAVAGVAAPVLAIAAGIMHTLDDGKTYISGVGPGQSITKLSDGSQALRAGNMLMGAGGSGENPSMWLVNPVTGKQTQISKENTIAINDLGHLQPVVLSQFVYNPKATAASVKAETPAPVYDPYGVQAAKNPSFRDTGMSAQQLSNKYSVVYNSLGGQAQLGLPFSAWLQQAADLRSNIGATQVKPATAAQTAAMNATQAALLKNFGKQAAPAPVQTNALGIPVHTANTTSVKPFGLAKGGEVTTDMENQINTFAEGGEVTKGSVYERAHLMRGKQQGWKGYLCTKDCSGHEAGYAWQKSHKGITPYTKSNSFMEGADAEELGLAKGGEVQMKKNSGYADGGVVSDTSTDVGAPQDTLLAPVSRVLSALGQDPNQANQVISALKALNPDATDSDILTNLGKNLPTVLAAATKTPNVTTDPQKLQGAQDNVNAQRTDAAAQVQRNQQALPYTLYNFKGNQAAADAYNNTPMTTVNAAQKNVDASGATQGTALTNQGQDITNQTNLQKAQQEGIETKQKAMGLGNAAQANDPNSAYSKAYVSGLQKQLIATGHPGAAQIAENLTGMSAVQADGASTAILGRGAQAATIRSTAATAALTASQVGYEQARSDIAQRANEEDKAASTGGANGETDDSTFGAQNRPPPSPIAAQLSGSAAARTTQNQGNQTYAQSLSNGGDARAQAEQNLDELITQVEGIKGPIGPGTSILDKIDPKRQIYEKVSQQYLAALGGATDSARAGIAGGFPQLDKINDKSAFLKQLQIAKARLLKVDALASEYQRRGSKTGDFGDLNPGAAYGSMKSFAFVAPDGHTVDIKAYGNTKQEQLRLMQDVQAAKKKGLTLQSADQ